MNALDSRSPNQTLSRLQALAPQVLERLGQMAPLPAHGTVAGQAVASVVWELMNLPMRGPIKDIDVFVNPGVPRPLRGRDPLPPDFDPSAVPHRRTPTSSHYRNFEVATRSYDHVKFIAARLSLRILNTYQAGLLNFTLISSSKIGHGDLAHDDMVSQELVDGFDLNAVGVGINLDTGTLVASPAFLEFLESHKLAAQTCNTPAHTLIRLARKYHEGELKGVSCDYEDQRTLLELALACQQAYEEARGRKLENVRTFGERFHGEHQRLAAHLPPCEQAPTLKREEESAYHTYRLVPRQHWSATDQALIDWAGRDGFTGLRHAAAIPALVSYLPLIRSLVGPNASSLSQSDRQSRLDALEQMHLALPGREQAAERLIAQRSALSEEELGDIHVRALFQVLGKTIPTPTLSSMGDSDRTVFFLNQHCASDPRQVEQVVQAWERLSEIERAVVLDMNLGADWVRGLFDDPTRNWDGLFASRAGEVINFLTSEGQRQRHPSQVGRMLMGVLSTLDKPEHAGDRDVLMSWTYALFFPRVVFNDVIKALPAEHRQHMATRVIKWSAPSWPDLSDLDSEAKRKVVAMWVNAGQQCPPGLIDSLQAQDAADMIRLLFEGNSGNEGVSPTHAAQVDAVFSHFLAKVPASQWGQGRAQLVRACVMMGRLPVLAQAAARLEEDRDAIDEALELAASSLRAFAERNRPGDMSNDNWRSADDPWWSYASRLEQYTGPLDRLIHQRRMERTLPCGDVPRSSSRLRM